MNGGRFPEVMLAVSAVVWAGFGLWLSLRPDAIADVGLTVSSPTRRAEVRAFYGGVELGIAAFLGWCVWAGAVREGLVAALLVVGGAGVMRLAGAALESFAVDGAMYGFAALELTTAVATVFALRSLASREATS